MKNDEIKEQAAVKNKRELLAELLRNKETAIKIAPMSFAQQRLWFLAQLNPGHPMYNITCKMIFNRDIHSQKLEEVIQQIIQRHDSLRTVFLFKNNEPVQVIKPKLNFSVDTADLKHLDEDDRQTESERIIEEEANFRFNLSVGPLFRIRLITMAKDKHILVLNIHHIISDYLSIRNFLHEMQESYKAYVEASVMPSLPGLKIQYPDYAIWQRKYYRNEKLTELLNFWKGKLYSPLPQLTLPFDKLRLENNNFRGSHYKYYFSNDISRKLMLLARQEQMSPYQILLTAFNLFLQIYSQQKDILIGTYVANRNRKELEPLIGFFINIVALRNDLSGNPSFIELLHRIRKNTLECLEYQDFPFERIVEEISSVRSASYNPLVQVMFQALKRTDGSLMEEADYQVEPVFNQSSKFDISFDFWYDDDSLDCICEYNSDLFEGSTIQRMIRHLDVLLNKIAEDPSKKINDFGLLTDEEYHQQLFEWNATQKTFPEKLTLPQLFARQVVEHPEHLALKYENSEYTYQELNQKSNKLAHYLLSQSENSGNRYGVLLERSPELIISLLGILKAGGIYIPIDPKNPKGRIKHIIDNSKITVFLTQEKFLSILPEMDCDVIAINRDWEIIKEMSTQEIEINQRVDDLSCIMYTSGSTGHPKGVMLTHKGVVNRILWMANEFQFAQNEKFAQKTSINFIDSIWEMLLPLVQGVELHVFSDNIVLDPKRFLEDIAKNQITRITVVPSYLKELLKVAQLNQINLPVLKFVFCGGEAMKKDLVEMFYSIFPDASLVNIYGSTEVSADASFFNTKSVELTRDVVPIGRPIDNTKMYILDETLKCVPIGVVGDIYVSGDCLFKGYFNNPALTEQVLFKNPFEPYEMLYRMGDCGCYRADGTIEYHGRKDSQIKIRGIRVELDEIDSTLNQHYDITESATVLQKGENPKIICFYQSDKSISTLSLRRYLKGRLPEYMIPQYFVKLNSLPKNPNGKIDRKKLEAQKFTGGAIEKNIRKTRPNTEIEKKVASIWGEILGLSEIFLEDNFFDIGGNSLLSIKVIYEIEKELNVRPNFKDFFNQSLKQFIKTIQPSGV